MKIIKNENIEFFDVDDTLVMHQAEATIPYGEMTRVWDSVTKKGIIVRINRPMVRLLIEAKSRGFYVIVWSKGGYQWAEDVLKSLGLETYVDQVMSKPLHYFDDKNVQEWLTDRIYINPDTIYKQTT